MPKQNGDRLRHPGFAEDWLNAQFGVIQIIIVTIVVLGIFNTVSTGVLERKQEIGTLRANGESRYDVMRLLCLEGLALGVLGAALGIIVALDSTSPCSQAAFSCLLLQALRASFWL